MGCNFSNPPSRLVYADTDGSIHELVLGENKLQHRKDDKVLGQVRALALHRTNTGAYLYDEQGTKSELKPNQVDRLELLTNVARIELHEHPSSLKKVSTNHDPNARRIIVSEVGGEQEAMRKDPQPATIKDEPKKLRPKTAKTTNMAVTLSPMGGQVSTYAITSLRKPTVMVDVGQQSGIRSDLEIGSWVNTWSQTRNRWIRAQVVSFENDNVILAYKAPDGVFEKVLPQGSKLIHKCPPEDQGPSQTWEVMKKYVMLMGDGDMLGQGSNSICRRGIELSSGRVVAIKIYKQTPDHASEQEFDQDVTMKKFVRQIEVLQDLARPWSQSIEEDATMWSKSLENIDPSSLFMHLIDYSQDADGKPAADSGDGMLYVVNEIAQYTMLDYLKHRRQNGEVFSQHETRLVAHSITTIVAGLHAKGYAHLDIKPENLMVFSGVLKLIDMDGCIKLSTEVYTSDQSLSCSPVYAAPEWADFCVSRTTKSLRVRPGLDSWSVGMTICEMVLDTPVLFEKYDSFMENFTTEEIHAFMEWLAHLNESPLPAEIDDVNPDLNEFLTKTLLVCDSTCRQTCAQALEHPYFASLGSDKDASAMLAGTAAAQKGGKRLLRTGTAKILRKDVEGSGAASEQWDQVELLLAQDGSLMYRVSADGYERSLVDDHSIRSVSVHLLSAKTGQFQLKWEGRENQDDDGNVTVEVGPKEFSAWVAIIRQARTGKVISINCGRKITNIRAKNAAPAARRMFEHMVAKENANVGMAFSGNLFVSDPANKLDIQAWPEVECHLTSEKGFWYKDDNGQEVALCETNDLRYVMLKEEESSSDDRWPFRFHIAGAGGAATRFAASSEEERQKWFGEIGKLKQQAEGAELVEYVADETVQRLGMEFDGSPPKPVTVIEVTPDMWADSCKIPVGSKLVEVNFQAVKDMDAASLSEILQIRPLTLRLAVIDPKKGGEPKKTRNIAAKTKRIKG